MRTLGNKAGDVIKPMPLPPPNEKRTVAFIGAELAKTLKRQLEATLSVLPLHDPYDVTASIQRADGRNWTDPNVGSGGNTLIHPILKDKESNQLPEVIRFDLLVGYKYFQVDV